MTPEPVEKCKLQIATTVQPSSNEETPCRAAIFAEVSVAPPNGHTYLTHTHAHAARLLNCRAALALPLFPHVSRKAEVPQRTLPNAPKPSCQQLACTPGTARRFVRLLKSGCQRLACNCHSAPPWLPTASCLVVGFPFRTIVCVLRELGSESTVLFNQMSAGRWRCQPSCNHHSSNNCWAKPQSSSLPTAPPTPPTAGCRFQRVLLGSCDQTRCRHSQYGPLSPQWRQRSRWLLPRWRSCWLSPQWR